LVGGESFVRSESHARDKNTDRCAEKHRAEGPRNQEQDDDAVERRQMHTYSRNSKDDKIGGEDREKFYTDKN
jgi:hypothetical protein